MEIGDGRKSKEEGWARSSEAEMALDDDVSWIGVCLGDCIYGVFYLAYPVKSWLKGFDRSIVHRRVINLERYFERRGWQVPIDDDHPLLPGDIVICRIVGKLPHVMIVSDRLSQKGHPLGIHNVAHGTVEEDCLFRYGPITRYRCAATMTIPLPLK